MEKSVERKLVRGIRQWDLVGVVINSIIGAGIFVLPATSFKRIGSYSLIAFVVCALVAALIILCFAEVSSRFEGTGGPYLYSREAFGPAVGFQVGWINWIARLTSYATNCNLMIVYLGFLLATRDVGLAASVDNCPNHPGIDRNQLPWCSERCHRQQLFYIRKAIPIVLVHRGGVVFFVTGKLSTR